jgi:hypothetical protein
MRSLSVLVSVLAFVPSDAFVVTGPLGHPMHSVASTRTVPATMGMLEDMMDSVSSFFKQDKAPVSRKH